MITTYEITTQLLDRLRSSAIETIMKLWNIETTNDPRPDKPLWQHFDDHKKEKTTHGAMTPPVIEALLVDRHAYLTHVTYVCRLCGDRLHYFDIPNDGL